MNKQKTSRGSHPEALTEKEVASFLSNHPDFFSRNLRLLEDLRLPHPTHGAVSLVEKQLSMLRERNQQLAHKLDELIRVARENEQLSANLHRLGLGLIQADSLDSVLAVSREQLCDEFKADEVVIRLIAQGQAEESDTHFCPSDDPGLAYFDDFFAQRRPVCGVASPEQLAWLFGESVSARIRSAVLIPLYDTQAIGILALGGHDVARFKPGMGTLFLGHLGEQVGAAVSHHLGRS